MTDEAKALVERLRKTGLQSPAEAADLIETQAREIERLKGITNAKVRKTKGYSWPGVVVADFTTLSGQRRLVVECTVPEVSGALHIYAPEQVEALGGKP